MPDETKLPQASQPQEPPKEEPKTDLDTILAEAPPKVQKEVRRLIQMTGMAITGPMASPLTEKLTGEHVSKMIEFVEEDSKREDKQLYSGRRFAFAYFLVAVLFIGIFLVVLVIKGKDELALQILTALGTFGGGYGVAKLRTR